MLLRCLVNISFNIVIEMIKWKKEIILSIPLIVSLANVRNISTDKCLLFLNN